MFVCKYCNAKFTRESTLSVHMCEPKRRWKQQNERFVQLAFRSYQHFYKQTMSQAVNERSYEDFSKSRFLEVGPYEYIESDAGSFTVTTM